MQPEIESDIPRSAIVDTPLTEIQSFYKGSNVFITGVTGFMGNVFLAKLLGSCPGIEKIYLLIRKKKGQSATERLNNMLNKEIFDTAKRACPDYMYRLRVVEGDCEQVGLGLKEADREELRDKVTVVFNFAATINFDETLKYAANMNVRCTDQMIELAKTMPNLKSFVHVSTAFSNCVGRVDIAEKYYEPPMSADMLMQMVDNLDENTLQRITPGLLGEYPNTYVYTKAIAEDVCRKKGSAIPLAIFRPSIVVSTFEEPKKGFAGNAAGPIGMGAAIYVGLMHTLYCDAECIMDVVPCDYAINAITAIAKVTANNWENRKAIRTICEKSSLQPIYNFASSNTKNKVTWKEFIEIGLNKSDIAYNKAIWIPFLIITKNKFLYWFATVFLHIIPALLIDSIATWNGSKPRMMKAYQRIHKSINLFSFFTNNQWNISNENVQSLWESLSARDRHIFQFNLNEINWQIYMENFAKGINKYILKEKPADVAYNRSKKIKLKIAHYSLVCGLVGLMSWLVFITLKWTYLVL